MTEETTEIELIPVHIIGEKGRSALVQVQGPKRYYVPKSAVIDRSAALPPTERSQDRYVAADVIAKGIEYGIRWEEYLDLSEITPDELASKLRKNGIWTHEDLQQRDRKLIRIATNTIGRAVQQAAKRAGERKPPRRKKNASKQ